MAKLRTPEVKLHRVRDDFSLTRTRSETYSGCCCCCLHWIGMAAGVVAGVISVGGQARRFATTGTGFLLGIWVTLLCGIGLTQVRVERDVMQPIWAAILLAPFVVLAPIGAIALVYAAWVDRTDRERCDDPALESHARTVVRTTLRSLLWAVVGTLAGYVVMLGIALLARLVK